MAVMMLLNGQVYETAEPTIEAAEKLVSYALANGEARIRVLREEAAGDDRRVPMLIRGSGINSVAIYERAEDASGGLEFVR